MTHLPTGLISKETGCVKGEVKNQNLVWKELIRVKLPLQTPFITLQNKGQKLDISSL